MLYKIKFMYLKVAYNVEKCNVRSYTEHAHKSHDLI